MELHKSLEHHPPLRAANHERIGEIQDSRDAPLPVSRYDIIPQPSRGVLMFCAL